MTGNEIKQWLWWITEQDFENFPRSQNASQHVASPNFSFIHIYNSNFMKSHTPSQKAPCDGGCIYSMFIFKQGFFSCGLSWLMVFVIHSLIHSHCLILTIRNTLIGCTRHDLKTKFYNIGKCGWQWFKSQYYIWFK